MKIINVVGTQPNLMKIAPLVEEMRRHAGIEQILLHTGQHYDASLSQVFFDELGIPQPDITLGVGRARTPSRPLASWWASSKSC